MRNTLLIIMFFIIAMALYVIWVSLNAKIVAIESNTGSYVSNPGGQPAIDINIEHLLAQLSLLEVAQQANTEAIAELLRRLQAIEAEDCRGAACLTRVSRREVIYFEHNDSQLSQSERDKIDQILLTLTDQSFISLRGHADASGNNQYNHLLSLRRAAAVKRYIDGVFRLNNKLDNLLISIDGTGEEFIVNATEDGIEEASNRIVEILIFE